MCMKCVCVCVLLEGGQGVMEATALGKKLSLSLFVCVLMVLCLFQIKGEQFVTWVGEVLILLICKLALK